MSNCVEMRALLPLRSVGALEADEDAALSQHLGGCSACERESKARDEAVALLQEPLEAACESDLGRLFPAIWERARAAPAGGETPAPAAPVNLHIALVCAFCKDVLGRADAAYCASCLAPHHEECFRAHGKCSAYGCEETLTVKPTLVGAAREGKLAAKAPPSKASPSRQSVSKAPAASPTRRARLVLYSFLGASAVAAVAALALDTERGARLLAGLWPDRRPRKHSAPARPSPGPVPEGERRISIDLRDVDLPEAVRLIAAEARACALVAPDAHGNVTLVAKDQPWRSVLEQAAEQADAEVVTLRDGAALVERPEKVSLQLTDPNVRTVIALVGATSGLSVIVSPEVRGDQTVAVRDQSWRKVLRAVARTCGDYVVERRGDFVVVKPRSSPPIGRPDIELAEWPRPLGPGEPEPARVTLDLEARPLQEAIAALSVGRAQIQLPRALATEPVTIHAHGVGWRDVLAALARTGGFRVRELAGALLLEARPRTSFSCTDANLRSVTSVLAQRAGLDVAVSPELRGSATFDARDFFYDEALETIVRCFGPYVVLHDGPRLVRITPRVVPTRSIPVVLPEGRPFPLEVAGFTVDGLGDPVLLQGGGVECRPGDLVAVDQQFVGARSDVRLVAIHGKTVELEDTRTGARALVRVGE